MTEAVERAKAEARNLRVEPGIPVRVLLRDGRVIWSKVDDQMRDLTTENSEGMLHHVRSLFVPHGEQSPVGHITELAEARKLTAAIDLISRFQWRDGDEKSAAVAMRHIARKAAALSSPVEAG